MDAVRQLLGGFSGRCSVWVRVAAACAAFAGLSQAQAQAPATAPPADAHRMRPMEAKVWFASYQKYRAISAGIADLRDASRHYELGRVAWEHGLEDEAWEQWLAALYLDPEYAEARAAIGYERSGGAWVRPSAVNTEWVAAVESAGRALQFAIGIEDDADALFFREFSWRLRRLNWLLWDLTEGQVFLKRIVVADKTNEGRIVIEKGKLDKALLDGGGAICQNPGRPDWRVVSGGRCYVRVLCHELFHGIFGLPDERHGCPCIMQGGLYGVKTSELRLCDAATHAADTTIRESCWETILRRFPDMKHPNPMAYGSAPEVEIEIRDQ